MARFERRILTFLLAGLLSVAPSGARASAEPYLGFGAGAWKFRFRQEGFGQTVRITSGTSLSLCLEVGLQSRWWFVEYAPQLGNTHLGSRAFAEAQPDDAMYFSLLAANAGVRLPATGTRIYYGRGYGNLDFSFGTGEMFSGGFWRLGVRQDVWSFSDFVRVDVRAEYQRNGFHRDSSGRMPAGLAANADIYWLGIGMSFGRMPERPSEGSGPGS
jgi:hypothetical protein